MTDEQLLRYSRHVLLEGMGIEGQQRVLASRVLLVGVGGLGSAALLYLAAAGVGQLVVVDPDTVELTNLQRQVAHSHAAIGQAKVASARAAVAALNPEVELIACHRRADAAWLADEVARADVVVDCSDNAPTRHAINAACVRARTPWVFGAALGFDGQVSVFDGRDASSPCYACLFPADLPPAATDCAHQGVFSPLVGIIGSVQAAEALKRIAGVGGSLCGRLLMLDARTLAWRELRIQRSPACPVCGSQPQ